MEEIISTSVFYGFIAIVIMLICIYHRLGKLLNNNKDISKTLDEVVINLEHIDTNTDEGKDKDIG